MKHDSRFDDESLAILTRFRQKNFQARGIGRRYNQNTEQGHTQNENKRKVQRYDCFGVGHLGRDCINRTRNSTTDYQENRLLNANQNFSRENSFRGNSNPSRGNFNPSCGNFNSFRGNSTRFNNSNNNSNSSRGSSRNSRGSGYRFQFNNRSDSEFNRRGSYREGDSEVDQNNETMKNRDTPFLFMARTTEQEYSYGKRILPINSEKIAKTQTFITGTNLIHKEHPTHPRSIRVLFNQSSIEDSIEKSFLLDSGATDHIVGDLFGLRNIRKLPHETSIRGAKDSFMMAPTHISDMHILARNRCDELNKIELKDVLYVPGLDTNLMLEDKLTQNGVHIRFTLKSADIYIPDEI